MSGLRIAAGVLLLLCLPATLAAANPDPLSATTLTGRPFALADERGKVVIVNFWATWCVPCRVEMPAFDTYYRAHRGEGLDMIAVSLDASGSRKKLSDATAGFAFPVARIDDVRMPRSAIPAALPTTRIYGRDGVLRYDSAAHKGQILDAATLASVVAPLLREGATTPR